MAAIDRAAFLAAVRDLDPETLTRLVAALWAARGIDAERVGPRRLRLDDGRLLTVGQQPDADVVVALDGGDVDADRLYEIAAYAVDRERLATLSERFFDRPVDAFTTDAAADPTDPVGSTPPSGDASDGRAVPARRLAAFTALAVGLAVAVAALALVGLPGGDRPASGEAGDATTPTVTPAPVATPNPTPAAASVPAEHLPPGVDARSVDERRLAAAHTDLLANRSYRLTLVYREFVDGVPSGIRRETVRVADGRYVATVDEVGEFRTAPTSVVDGDTYANETTRIERTADGIATAPRTDDDRLLDAQARFVRYYLSVSSSRVVDAPTVAGRPGVWLVTDGDPWPGVANATGSALVDRRGLVHELVRRYDDPNEPGVSVVLTVRVEAVGETTVTTPGWYENATTSSPAAAFPHDGTDEPV